MKMRVMLITGILVMSPFLLCAQENFQYSYSANGDEVIEWLIPSNDGNLILAGNTNSADPSGDGLIMKTDLEGTIIWSKIIGGPGWDEIVRIISCTDGGYVAIGFTNSYGQGERDAWITRIDESGEVVWSSCFGAYSWDGARAVAQLSDGSFMVVGHTDDFTNGFMLSLDSQGNFLWKKEITRDYIFWFNDVVPKSSGGYFFAGCMNYYGFGIHDTFIMESDQNGNLIKGKVYGSNNNDAFRILLPWEDGFLAVGDTWSWFGQQLGWITEIDKNFEITKSIVIGDSNIDRFVKSACTANGSIYAALQTSNDAAFIIKIDSNFLIRKSWRFNPGVMAYSSSIIFNENNVAFSGSYVNSQGYSEDIYMARFNPDSLVDCNLVSSSATFYFVSPMTGNLSFFENSSSAVYRLINLSSSDISLTRENLCKEENIISADFSIPGDVCANDPVTIVNNCHNAISYQWYFQGAFPETSNAADPGVIRYENPGIYPVELVVFNESNSDNCTRYITIYPEIAFSLGPDTTITPDVSLQFILIGGYDEYLWSTGDTTTYLSVNGYKLNYGNNPIWLQITNGPCISSDTINIYKIREQDFAELVIYPNPAWEGSLIRIKSEKVPLTVIFYNMLGQKIKVAQPLDNSFYLLGIEPGVYIVELLFEPNRVLRRFIVL